MQQPYGFPPQPMSYAPPAPQPPAPVQAAAQGGGSNTIVWVIGAVVVLCVVGGAIFASSRPAAAVSQAPSIDDIVARVQASTPATATPTPETLQPLCPENLAPVLDADGKIYKNVCYAMSTNAKGPLVPSPVGQPGGIPSAVGTDTSLATSAPVIYQGKGGQSVNGIVQGNPKVRTTSSAPGPRPTSAPPPGADCASRGPANLTACCVAKARQGIADRTCPRALPSSR